MMKYFKNQHLTVVAFFIVLVTFSACSDDDDTNTDTTENCDETVIVDNNTYENIPEEVNFSITEVSIEGNCLDITLSSSGCDGNTWEIELVDSENIMESLPPQRNLKVSLKNNETCLAIVTKSISFDISPLQVENNQVRLNIDGWEEPVTYTY